MGFSLSNNKGAYGRADSHSNVAHSELEFDQNEHAGLSDPLKDKIDAEGKFLN